MDQDAVGGHKQAKKKRGKCLHDQKLEQASLHDQKKLLPRGTRRVIPSGQGSQSSA